MTYLLLEFLRIAEKHILNNPHIPSDDRFLKLHLSKFLIAEIPE
jgi:hypothetical protein